MVRSRMVVRDSDVDNPNMFRRVFHFPCVKADPASPACPAHLGSLDVTSRTLAAVMCDAEDPCSVNTAHEPESSFTKSPRSTYRVSRTKFLAMLLFARVWGVLWHVKSLFCEKRIRVFVTNGPNRWDFV